MNGDLVSEFPCDGSMKLEAKPELFRISYIVYALLELTDEPRGNGGYLYSGAGKLPGDKDMRLRRCRGFCLVH